MSFEALRLNEPLLRAVRTSGYRTPTPIQTEAIPHVLAGRDVLGCAQTGTGKTAAFALPILQRLSGSPRGSGPACKIRALILCPTRELAQQIHDSFCTYGAHTGVRQTVIYGGVGQGPQARALKAGVDVLIATPGRLIDLMGQRLVSLAGVEILVLDEADRMLDMGFLPDIRRILAQVPRQRQTLLFSATMPTAIRQLSQDLLRNAVPVQIARVSSPAPTVAHFVYHVEQPEKPKLLMRLSRRALRDRALVFTRTKHGADKLTKHLLRAGVRAAALHGNKSQGARTRALAEFRSALTPVLVATDLAARGLDVDDIAQVFNYDLTADPETYVHRIGRTGRAGAAGTAVSFCSSQERANLRGIERLLQTSLSTATLPHDGTAPQRAAAPLNREERLAIPPHRTDRAPMQPHRAAQAAAPTHRAAQAPAPMHRAAQAPTPPNRAGQTPAPFRRSDRGPAPSNRGRRAPAPFRRPERAATAPSHAGHAPPAPNRAGHPVAASAQSSGV